MMPFQNEDADILKLVTGNGFGLILLLQRQYTPSDLSVWQNINWRLARQMSWQNIKNAILTQCNHFLLTTSAVRTRL